VARNGGPAAGSCSGELRPESTPKNKKPTFGLVTEVGCLRFVLSFAYRAVPPHSGALLELQQMQAPMLALWLMELWLSYRTAGESQSVEWLAGRAGQPRPFRLENS